MDGLLRVTLWWAATIGLFLLALASFLGVVVVPVLVGTMGLHPISLLGLPFLILSGILGVQFGIRVLEYKLDF